MKNKKRVSVALIAMLVLIFSVTMVWGNSSDWGKVKMQRLNFTYSSYGSQYTGSAILMAPKTATTDAPVPGVLVLGGASSYSYAMKGYGIELARRGYAVMLVDLAGQGQSDLIGHNGGYAKPLPICLKPGGGEDVRDYIIAAGKELKNLTYVDETKMTIAGFSAGMSWAAQAAADFAYGEFTTVGNLSGYNVGNRDIALAAGINYFGIEANGPFTEKSDPGYEVPINGIAGVGSLEDGTADYCYHHAGAVQHQMQPTTPSLIVAVVDMMETLYPTGTTVPSGSTIFFNAEVFSGFAIIALFVLLACLIQALLTMDFFQSLKRPEPKKYPAMCGQKKSTAIAFLSFRVMLTIVLYEIFGARWQIIKLFKGWPWAGLWLNIWVPFFIALMVSNIIIFLVWHFTVGKKNGGNSFDYGIGWGNARDNAVNIFKSILLGLSIVFVITSFLNFLDLLLAINLKVMIFGLISFNLEHMTQMPTYILLYVGLLFSASLCQYISNPSYEDGTVKSQIIATVRTTFVAILPYLVLVTWNTLKGTRMITMAGTYGVDQFAPLDNMYGYPIMMSLVTPIMDIMKRKTKSIWPGVIVCAMLLGVLVTCNYSLNDTWFG